MWWHVVHPAPSCPNSFTMPHIHHHPDQCHGKLAAITHLTSIMSLSWAFNHHTVLDLGFCVHLHPLSSCCIMRPSKAVFNILRFCNTRGLACCMDAHAQHTSCWLHSTTATLHTSFINTISKLTQESTCHVRARAGCVCHMPPSTSPLIVAIIHHIIMPPSMRYSLMFTPSVSN